MVPTFDRDDRHILLPVGKACGPNHQVSIEGAAFTCNGLRERDGGFDPAARPAAGGCVVPHLAGRARPAAPAAFPREDALALFRDADLLPAPATPCAAPEIGQTTFTTPD